MSDEIPPLLARATHDDLMDSFAYALRYDDRGKPISPHYRERAHLMAEWLIRHMHRRGFVVMKRAPLGASPGYERHEP